MLLTANSGTTPPYSRTMTAANEHNYGGGCFHRKKIQWLKCGLALSLEWVQNYKLRRKIIHNNHFARL
jgi:hypothetical protein